MRRQCGHHRSHGSLGLLLAPTRKQGHSELGGLLQKGSSSQKRAIKGQEVWVEPLWESTAYVHRHYLAVATLLSAVQPESSLTCPSLTQKAIQSTCFLDDMLPGSLLCPSCPFEGGVWIYPISPTSPTTKNPVPFPTHRALSMAPAPSPIYPRHPL